MVYCQNSARRLLTFRTNRDFNSLSKVIALRNQLMEGITMAKRARRKQSTVIGTLALELSALAGILGIAQPAVRNNVWSLVSPPTSQGAPLAPMSNVPALPHAPIAHTASVAPNAGLPAGVYATEQPPSFYSPTYTAQAVLPQHAPPRPLWRASAFNPMGGYQ